MVRPSGPDFEASEGASGGLEKRSQSVYWKSSVSFWSSILAASHGGAPGAGWAAGKGPVDQRRGRSAGEDMCAEVPQPVRKPTRSRHWGSTAERYIPRAQRPVGWSQPALTVDRSGPAPPGWIIFIHHHTPSVTARSTLRAPPKAAPVECGGV